MQANPTMTANTAHDAVRLPQFSARNLARIAGVLYLIIFSSGLFAEFMVRGDLKVAGDAAATAANILDSEALFRAGIAADMAMIAADVAIALAFFILLRPVSQGLAMLAAFFRLAQATVLGLNLLNLYFVLELVNGADYLGALGADQSNALALMFLNAHAFGYRLGLVFFGFSILVLGYLMTRSDRFPRILGIGLMVAAVAYLLDSVAAFALVNYADYEDFLSNVVLVPAFIAELAVTIWLLWKGVRSPESAPQAAPIAQPDGFSA